METMDNFGKEDVQRSTEFADVEIEAAFRFIDLDKNGFIGASEVRHASTCWTD